MNASDPLTDEEALDEAAASYQMTGEQAKQLAAKEGLVRALAETDQPLVLKGGTLMSHVFDSPRASIADVDYARPDDGIDRQHRTEEDEVFDIEAARRMATIDRTATQAFRIDGDRGRWTMERDLVEGVDVPFALTNLDLATDGQLAISGSVRRGEVLDGLHKVDFQPIAIRARSPAKVYGLTLEEASVEKILSWCLKGKEKHFYDLAFVARDYPDIAARDQDIRDMLVEKFDRERRSSATAHLYEDFPNLKVLLARLDRERRMNGLRRKANGSYRYKAGDRPDPLIFDPAEEERDDSLTDVENVIRMASAFWSELLGPLR